MHETDKTDALFEQAPVALTVGGVAVGHHPIVALTADASWLVEVDGSNPLQEPSAESWLTVANGRTGTRGSPEEPGKESSPAVFVAGVYRWVEGPIPGPDLVQGPLWPSLQPRVDGEPVALDRGETIEDRHILDLRQGMLFREWSQRLPSGAVWSFRSARFASLAQRGLLVLQAEATCSGGTISLAADIPLPDQANVRVRRELGPPGVETVTLAGRMGRAVTFVMATEEDDGRLLRLVGVGRTTDDLQEGEPGPVVAQARAAGPATLRAHHTAAWRQRWQGADAVVKADPELGKAVRFAIAHLIAAGDPETDLASIGARGLTGPGYRGHVFWDTDVFLMPFFIWTHPQTARALLGYRYRTLPAAKEKAAALGYAGALYAWESADTGEEATPSFAWRSDGVRVAIRTGEMEHHISADVAWAAMQYWRVTGDTDFLLREGAEIVLETARFWASRATLGADGQYHIDAVIGPDEYHEDVRDNAFTNVLARWNLRAAAELVEWGATAGSEWRELTCRIGLRPDEVSAWLDVADRLVDGFDPQSLLYEQFAGYFELEDVSAVDLASRPFAGDVLLGAERARRSQLVKQADVLMLLLMLPELLSPEVAEANYRYYEPRTCHGSSLSPSAHAVAAARVGAMEDAEWYFRMAAGIDLGDYLGNTALGLHFAALGGLWQAVVMGFGGVRSSDSALHLDPRVAPGLGPLSFVIRWRQVRVAIEIQPDRVILDLDGRIPVVVGDQAPVPLGPGRVVAQRDARGWLRPGDGGH